MSKNPKTSVDRFTDLPDHLAHKVLSSLSALDLSRLSVVSKRCRELCMSTPFLSFDSDSLPYSEPKRARFMNYIDRLLLSRKGSTEIQTFSIRWFFHYGPAEEEYRVLSWLQAAVASEVREIFVHVNFSKARLRSPRFSLPSNLLLCKNLESLTLRFAEAVPVPFPFFFGFSSALKTLRLNSVRVDDSFGLWISQCCKFLKVLELFYVTGATFIAIDSASLQRLSASFGSDQLLCFNLAAENLRWLCLEWRISTSAGQRLLQLSAPNLEAISLRGNISNFEIAENFNSLVRTAMFLEHSYFTRQEIVLSLLPSVRNIKRLTLSDTMLKHLLKVGKLSILFNHLTDLRVLRTKTSYDLVRAVASFFVAAPNLSNFFVITMLEKFKEIRRPEQRLESLDNVSLMDNLKCVTIELFVSRGNEDELDLTKLGGNGELALIKFFLINARNLEKIRIYHGPSLTSDVRLEINGCEKASSKVEVSFLPIWRWARPSLD